MACSHPAPQIGESVQRGLNGVLSGAKGHGFHAFCSQFCRGCAVRGRAARLRRLRPSCPLLSSAAELPAAALCGRALRPCFPWLGPPWSRDRGRGEGAATCAVPCAAVMAPRTVQ